jgi:hypothetical protein
MKAVVETLMVNATTILDASHAHITRVPSLSLAAYDPIYTRSIDSTYTRSKTTKDLLHKRNSLFPQRSITILR